MKKILQIGDGNFIRCFILMYIMELNSKQDDKFSIIMSQSRGNEERINILRNNDLKYNIIAKNNDEIYLKEVDIIKNVINPTSNYLDLLNVADDNECNIIISNTTEKGLIYNFEKISFEQKPSSYTATLTSLLYKRYLGDKKGFLIIPTELVANNGDVLKNNVLKCIKDNELDDDFFAWVKKDNYFINNIVDRIVSGFDQEAYENIIKDELLIVTEKYSSFLLENNEIINDYISLEICDTVKYVDNLGLYSEQKIKILNGIHTTLVSYYVNSEYIYVHQCMNDEDVLKMLDKLFVEISDTLSISKEENSIFYKKIINRLKNSTLNHKLTDIALNNTQKFNDRIINTLNDYYKTYEVLPPNLTKVVFDFIYKYKDTIYINDDAEFFDALWIDGNLDYDFLFSKDSSLDIKVDRELFMNEFNDYLKKRNFR